MNKQKFVQYLRTPSSLDQQSLADLEALIDDFPYFQNARTLLAKGSKQQKSKKAGQHVGTAAIYATDRALLKRYINDQLIFLSPLEVHESHEAELGRELTDSIKSNRIVSAHVKQTGAEEKAPPKKKVITRPKAKPEAPKNPAPEVKKSPEPSEEMPKTASSNLDHIIDELYRDMEALKINRAKFQEIENQLAEDEAVDNAVKRATTKSSKKPTTKETPKSDKTKEDTENQNPDGDAGKSKKVDSTSEQNHGTEEPVKPISLKEAAKSRAAKKTATQKAKEADSPTKKTTRKVSTSKTKSAATKKTTKKASTAKAAKTTASKSKTTAKKETAKTSSTKAADTKKEASSSKDKKEDSSKKEDKGERKTQQDEIIANFIKSNPSISPADSKAFKSDEDLSGNSTELHPDIASEYLAEIYLEQGRKERAIQIYESLMVRIPEKSVYFADIIKKLNEEK